MFNMKKTAIAAAVATSAAIAGPASAAAITSMTITGSEFFMNNGIGGGSAYTTGSSTDLVSGYLGNGGGGVAGLDCDPDGPVCFTFFGSKVNTYTAEENIGDTNNAAGSIPGGPVPTGDITGDVMTLDVESWFANWNGTDFSQGHTQAGDAVTASTDWSNTADFAGQTNTGSVSCVGSSCTFTGLRWEAYITGGSFDGNTGWWLLNGTVTAVPVPAAVWLFGSGLLGLIGIARRRKAI